MQAPIDYSILPTGAIEIELVRKTGFTSFDISLSNPSETGLAHPQVEIHLGPSPEGPWDRYTGLAPACLDAGTSQDYFFGYSGEPTHVLVEVLQSTDNRDERQLFHSEIFELGE